MSANRSRSLFFGIRNDSRVGEKMCIGGRQCALDTENASQKKGARRRLLACCFFRLHQNECCRPTPIVVTSVPGMSPPAVPLKVLLAPERAVAAPPSFAAGPAM